MWIRLFCACCSCQYRSPVETPASQVLDQMTDDSPWFALAEGDTFEGMVSAALDRRGRILCPECGEEVQVLYDSKSGSADGLLSSHDSTRTR